jgi:hypothetical protein
MSQRTLVETLELWEEANEALAIAKFRESELRAQLVNICSGGLTLDEGTNKFPVPGNRHEIIKIVQPYSYTVDKDIWLTKVAGKLPAHLCEDGVLMKIQPKLSLSAYRKLSNTHLKLVDLAVTAKPGTPQVEVKLIKR